MIEENDVVKVDLRGLPEEIDFASMTAKIKSQKNNTANTWQKNRSSFRKFTDLFPGDLAKNIVRIYLALNDINTRDYDKERTDDFKYPDKFDLQYEEKFFEIKSSIEKYNSDMAVIINNRNFIIYRGKELKDIIIQVFFIFSDENGKTFLNDLEKCEEKDFKEKYDIQSEDDFIELFIKYSPSTYILGFVLSKDIDPTKNYSVQTTQIKSDFKRDYVKQIIKEGRPMKELVTMLKNGVKE
jgi:hypothetical protein